jgi:RHS repeat-associated protein
LRGQRIDYERDILGRVTKKTPVSRPASEIITYTWDTAGISGSYGKGRLATVVDGSGTTRFKYDHRGNVLTKQQAIGTSTTANLAYVYDLADRVTQMTYPSGRQVLYTYDTKGRATQVRTRATSTATLVTLISAMTYEPFGPLKQATLGNTLSMTNSWGNDARLASKRLYVTSGGVNRSLLTYAYDNDDNITSITDGVDATRSLSFAYDAVDRLTQTVATSGVLKREDILYDPNGNRTRVERRAGASDPAPLESDVYGRTPGTNRLASVTTPAGVRSIAYDARGNTASETRPASVGVTTGYDGYGRLTSYTRTGDASQVNVYNGLDDRVTVTSGSTVRRYVYDADGRLLGEYGTSAADVVAESIWISAEVANDNQPYGGDDGVGGYAPLAVATGPSSAPVLTWVHGNHLGVPQAWTNSAGAATTAPAALLPGFPGQLRTFADLYYNRYRDYDPTTGRYIQADPIGLAGGENAYLYAEANPLKYVDPDGLCPMCLVIPAVCAGGGCEAAIAAIGLGAWWWSTHPPVTGPKKWTRPIDYTCPDDDDDDPCEAQRREDELECNQWNITGARHGYSKKEGYRVCMISAATRYGECRGRGKDPRKITTPLFLPTDRRGVRGPTRY